MAYLVLVAASYLTVASLVFGARRDDYSQLRDTLSELGAYGAPAQHAVNWGVFVPVALAMLVAAVSAWPQPASGLALALACGYLGAALFPCDPGAPLSGSRRQTLHSLAGGAEYGGGLCALIALAALREDVLFLAAAALLMIAVVGLTWRALARVRGALQRIGEASLFTALAYAL